MIKFDINTESQQLLWQTMIAETKCDVTLSVQLTNLAVKARKLLQIMRGSELEANPYKLSAGNNKTMIIRQGQHKKLEL